MIDAGVLWRLKRVWVFASMARSWWLQSGWMLPRGVVSSPPPAPSRHHAHTPTFPNDDDPSQYPSPSTTSETCTSANAERERARHTHPTKHTQTPALRNMQAFAGQSVAARTGLAAAAPRRVLVIEAAHKKGESGADERGARTTGELEGPPPLARARPIRAPRSSRNSPRPMRDGVLLGGTYCPGVRTTGFRAHRRARAPMAAPSLWLFLASVEERAAAADGKRSAGQREQPPSMLGV